MTDLCFSLRRTLLCLAFLSTTALAQVNINTASIKELTALGLTKTQALNVIKYRKVHKFKSTDELSKVRGISFSQAQNLAGKVSVSEAKKSASNKK